MSANKSPDLGGFTGDSAKHLKKFNTHPQVIQKNENKTEEERTLPKSLYEPSITLTPKQKNCYYKKRKLQPNIPDDYRCKNPQQNTSKLNPAIL